MTHPKDDFLILGFTGAFSSGCTTAAKFFEHKVNKVKGDFLAQKHSINTSIANFYNDFSFSKDYVNSYFTEVNNSQVEKSKEILKLVRRRQIINALNDVEDIKFFYISMTDVMYSLLVEHVVFETPSENDIPKRYVDLTKVLREWCDKKNISELDLKKICEALDKRNVEDQNPKVVFNYFGKLKSLRKKLSETYSDKPFELFHIMQCIGNNLRKCRNPFGDDENFKTQKYLDILSQRAGALLKFHRKLRKSRNPKNLVTYYLIECFRNPREVEYFRKRFYEFYLFSVFCDEQERFRRAHEKYGLKEKDCIKIDKVDQGGDYIRNQYMQNVKRCVYLADIAVTNQKLEYNFYEDLLKYYALIKKPGCIKPTHMERNMNLAYSMSLNSTCICRQVGAVIIYQSYIVGAGWNDSGGGRIGCVYRQRGDVARTNNHGFPISSARDYNLFKQIITEKGTNLDHSFCYKDEMAKLEREKSNLYEYGEKTGKNTERMVNPTLQHCRALHAEENAILQTSKLGGTGLQGATLYTTTFPCELCAKKILQVGIKRVIYCEPYPKSISMDVFFKESMKHIEVIPFEGVKSPSFFRLFKPSLDIKDMQELELMEARNS